MHTGTAPTINFNNFSITGSAAGAHAYGSAINIGQGVLDGQTIKDMEKKESILEIRTASAIYSLPAAEINIDSVSSQFGQSVKLKDIIMSVKIEVLTEDATKVVVDTANKNNYQVLVKPVDFEITCTNGGKTVTVSKFNGYVERMVSIPDGIDSKKVTTGVVLNKNGRARSNLRMLQNIGQRLPSIIWVQGWSSADMIQIPLHQMQKSPVNRQ
ncbi:MAG: hypothetical protein K0Q48_2695 [Bacillota bacterium]|jgi:hypothetical protein|nr:hypothetical protein [Bacillota bacterium]